MIKDKKKIIMFLLNDFLPDYRVLKEARTLTDLNYEVLIICTHFNKSLKNNEIIEDKFKIIRETVINIPILKYLHFWIKCYLKYRNHKSDIYVCHDLNTLPIGVRLKKKNKSSKLVYDSHEFFPAMISEQFGSVSYWLFLALERKTITKPNYVTTDSPTRSLVLKKVYKYKRKSIDHIFNTNDISFSEIKAKKLHKNPKELLLGIMGHVVPGTRGFELFPEFLGYVKENEDLIIRIIVLGDGSYRPILQKSLKDGGYSNMVKFYGHLPPKEAISVIKGCDIGLILFRATSLNPKHAGPNRIFDYMASGLPMIGTDLTEISRIITKEKVGWVIPLNNAKELYNIVMKLNNDKAQVKEYGKNAKEVFIKKYTWEKMEQKIKRIYKSLE